MKTLIIGKGDVGKALYGILSRKYETYIQDKEMEQGGEFEVIHICFPYSKYFEGDVWDYQEIYRAKYVVIHSTVPVGTTRRCQVFHSPVIGQHPYLEKSLLTFRKYLAPKDNKLKRYFEQAGIKIKQVGKPEETEALKLFLTTCFGISCLEEKTIWNWCLEHGLNYKTIYKDALENYNEGYIKLGYPQFVRPILKHNKGKIGGHCVIPNCDLLKHPLTNFLKKQNKEI